MANRKSGATKQTKTPTYNNRFKSNKPKIAWYTKPAFVVLAFVVVAILIVTITMNKKDSAATTASQSTQTQAGQQTQSDSTQVETDTASSQTKQKNNGYSKTPAMSIDTTKKYIATINTTFGAIEIELLPKVAPKTVNNFVFLAKDGYYNDIVFHRVVKNFMIQTGDPLGSGTGGPGYEFEDELGSGISYDSGVVAMANAGPNTNGSQFFICSGSDCKNLDNMPNYSIFGKVIKGMDVVEKIQSVDVEAGSSGEMSSPKSPISMKTITIQENAQ